VRLTVHSGAGATAQLVRPVGSAAPRVVDGGAGTLRIEGDAWRCVLPAAAADAAFVRHEDASGRRRHGLELWDGFGEPVLGIDLPDLPRRAAGGADGATAVALVPPAGAWQALRATLAGRTVGRAVVVEAPAGGRRPGWGRARDVMERRCR
jgi:hypothetical protein